MANDHMYSVVGQKVCISVGAGRGRGVYIFWGTKSLIRNKAIVVFRLIGKDTSMISLFKLGRSLNYGERVNILQQS